MPCNSSLSRFLLRVGQRGEPVLGPNANGFGVIGLPVLGSVSDLSNLLTRKAATVVGDRDQLSVAGALIHGGNIQDPSGIHFKTDINIRHESRRNLN